MSRISPDEQPASIALLRGLRSSFFQISILGLIVGGFRLLPFRIQCWVHLLKGFFFFPSKFDLAGRISDLEEKRKEALNRILDIKGQHRISAEEKLFKYDQYLNLFSVQVVLGFSAEWGRIIPLLSQLEKKTSPSDREPWRGISDSTRSSLQMSPKVNPKKLCNSCGPRLSLRFHVSRRGNFLGGRASRQIRHRRSQRLRLRLRPDWHRENLHHGKEVGIFVHLKFSTWKSPLKSSTGWVLLYLNILSKIIFNSIKVL